MATPTPYDLSSSAAEALSGTRHPASNIPYIADGVSPSSSPSLAAQHNNVQRHTWDLLDIALRAVKTDTLAIGVYPGHYRDASGTAKQFGGVASTALTDNATNYVYIDTASNALVVSTSGFPGTATTYIAVAIYVTSAGAIVTSDNDADRRDQVRCWVPASSSSPTGTTGTSFTLDDDNAGAGANTQLRANRGTDNGEDAAVEWDEANDRWNFRAQHSTATYCPINATELLISGTSMLDANGAAKVQSGVAGNGLGHSGGVLAVNVDGVGIEIAADSLQLKAAGVTAAKLSDAISDKIAQVSVGDASGASPRTVTIQVLDLQGNSLSETCYLQVGVYQDADAAATATNATIAVGASGTLVRTVTANKVLIAKTTSGGTLTVTIADAVLETVYVVVAQTTRSKILDCSDIGTVVIS